MIEEIQTTGVIEFHNFQKLEPFACSRGIGLKTLPSGDQSIHALACEGAGVEWGIGR